MTYGEGSAVRKLINMSLNHLNSKRKLLTCFMNEVNKSPTRNLQIRYLQELSSRLMFYFFFFNCLGRVRARTSGERKIFELGFKNSNIIGRPESQSRIRPFFFSSI